LTADGPTTTTQKELKETKKTMLILLMMAKTMETKGQTHTHTLAERERDRATALLWGLCVYLADTFRQQVNTLLAAVRPK